MNKQELENNQRYIDDDEIDLVDLFMIVWKRKTMIIVVTLLLTVAAAGISYLMPKVYEVTAIMEPGRDENGKPIESAQTIREKILGGAYDKNIIINLNLSMRDLPKFKVSIPKQTDLLAVSVETSSSAVAVKSLEMLITELKGEINSQVSLRKQSIENDVEAAIAESLSYPLRIKSLEKLISNTIQKTESLEKEKKRILTNPKGDSISLLLYLNELSTQDTSLNNLYNDLERLKLQNKTVAVKISNLRLKLAAIEPLSVNKPPSVSIDPVKPNKKLMVALAFILGLMGGIMLAFGAEFMTKVRSQQAKENH